MSDDLLDMLETLGPGLFALLTRLTLCEHAAEDLLQDLFVKLSQSHAHTRARNPGAYVRRAAINLAFDWRRSRRRIQNLAGVEADLVAPETSPLVEVERKEQFDAVLNAAGKLPEVLREVFVRRLIEQEDYDSIAADFDKSPHQIRALCFRAVSRIRALVGTPAADPEPPVRWSAREVKTHG